MTDILGAIYDFLANKLFPEGFAIQGGGTVSAKDVIVRGWQNRAGLPPYTEFVVLTLLSSKRHGTNVHKSAFDVQKDVFAETISMMTEYAIQVDFCGLDEEDVMNRANRLAIVARDAYACDYFRPYGFLPLYAEDVRNLSYIDEQRQWSVRYSVTLRIAGWDSHDAARDYFTSVNVEFEDVDVHHPVSE